MKIKSTKIANWERSKNFRRKIIRYERSSNDRHIFLTSATAILFQRSFGGNRFCKYFFGLPMDQAVAQGYNISIKGFFETTHSSVMVATAKTAKIILSDMGYKGGLTVADLFTGTGLSAWAYAKEGFTVDAIEADRFTSEYAQKNLERAGVADNITVVNTDAQSVITTSLLEGKQYAMVSLDPPWGEKYDYDLSKTFRLEHTEPSLEHLIRLSIPLAPVIVFRTPQSIDVEQVNALGVALNRQVLIQFQDMEGYPSSEQTAAIFMIASVGNHTLEHVKIVPTEF
ncbi:MAG TPA: RsmD family RNA methyltransferase [Candidatus Saccharimonadales bacterium]|nr:RsmD family RNA methyltransferase [Candidatus Saccharimonadales bacterium]